MTDKTPTDIKTFIDYLGGIKPLAERFIACDPHSPASKNMQNRISHWILNNTLPPRYRSMLKSFAVADGLILPDDFLWQEFSGSGDPTPPNDASLIIALGGSKNIACRVGDDVEKMRHKINGWASLNQIPLKYRPAIKDLADIDGVPLPSGW